MAAYALAQDVAAIRPFPDAQRSAVEAQLEYAAVLIRQGRAIDQWIADGTLDVEIPRFVSVQMVLAFLQNPEGHKSGSKSIDDYTVSWTLADAVAAGGMSAESWAHLLHPDTQGSGGAFTIRPAGVTRSPYGDCW